MKDMILVRHRECKECPPHFIRVRTTKPKGTGIFATVLRDFDESQGIRNWCYENIHHRFFIGSYSDLSSGHEVVEEYEVAAFEDASDATYFSLMLPTLK